MHATRLDGRKRGVIARCGTRRCRIPRSRQRFTRSIMMRRGGPELPALFPELGEPVGRLIRFMVNVLAIEVFAASTFAWAEAVLSDPEVSDAPEDAANLVRY